jgi:hypothetical protein
MFTAQLDGEDISVLTHLLHEKVERLSAIYAGLDEAPLPAALRNSLRDGADEDLQRHIKALRHITDAVQNPVNPTTSSDFSPRTRERQ